MEPGAHPVASHLLGSRLWTYTGLSLALLTLTALFAALVDGGWGLGQALLGALIGAGLFLTGAFLVQPRAHRRREP